jgi:hypothetical protein
MPADATVVPLRADMSEGPVARRDAPHEQPQPLSREQPEQPPREQPARPIEKTTKPEKGRNLPPDAGCAGRRLRCNRWR